MSLKNIEGHSGFAKNTATGAVLNINKKEIIDARARKARRKQEEQDLQNMKETVNKLETDVSEIKDLLNKIAEKL